MRYLLVDRITHLDPGARAEGVKNVTMSEDFLADHFPRNPVMPGALIVEGLIQLGSWLVVATERFERRGIVQLVDKAKFRRVVRPGDRILMSVELKSSGERAATFHGKATVDGELAASADFELELVALDSLEDPREARDLYAVLTRDLEQEAGVGASG